MTNENRSIPSIHELRNAPYNLVQEVFSGFVSPTAEGRFRGGVLVEKPTLLDHCPYANEWAPFDPNYHLESSFTLMQRRYATTALHCLDEIAKGTSSLGSEAQYRSLVITNTLNATADFSFALYEADMDLLRYFEQLNPNLMPAMTAVYELAGFQGLTEAIKSSADFLNMAVDGVLNAENVSLITAEETQHLRFVGAKKADRPRNLRREDLGFSTNDPQHHELRCLGELAAKTLIKEAAFAAIELSDPAFAEQLSPVLNYDDTDGIPWYNEIACRTLLDIGMQDLENLAKQRATRQSC